GRLHRRLPGRARRRLRGNAAAGPRGRLRQRLLVQVLAPPRHPGRRHARPDAGRGEGRASRPAAGAARRPAARVQRRPGRPHAAGAVRKNRPAGGSNRRAQSLSAGGALRWRGALDRSDHASPDHVGGAEQPGRRTRRRRLSRGPSEFLPLSEAGVRAAWGQNGRHAALFEDAFDVLLETPGGGVTLNGKAESRRRAKQALEIIAHRADEGLDVAQADVRVAIDQARHGHGGGPIGRRGAVAAKTAAQAKYLDLLSHNELVFALGPAGTGKTFLAVAHGAGLLVSGEVDRLVITRPAVEAGER